MERREVTLSVATVSYLYAAADTSGQAAVGDAAGSAASGVGRGRLLLLHGGGGDNAELSWGGLIPAFAAAGYEVWAPDHPGYGHSSPPRHPQRQAELLAYLDEYVAALGLGDAWLVGLSLGGAMALGRALAHPVPGLVLIAPGGLMPRLGRRRDQLLSWLLVRSRVLPLLTRLLARNPRWLRASLGSLVRDPDALPPAFVDEIRRALLGPGPRTFEQWQLGEVRGTRIATDYRTRLGDLTCPVLFVQGTADPAVPVARVREAAAAIPGSELVEIAGGRHWVQRDAPEEVHSAVLDFLERHFSAGR